MLRLYILVLLSFCTTLPLYAQKGSTDICELTVSRQLPELEKALENNDIYNIQRIIEHIEMTCGSNEFTNRIQILYQLIEKKSTQQTLSNYLMSSYDKQLIERLESAASPQYDILYERNKKKFHFVPLRHPVDSLVQAKALALLNSKEYTLNNTEKSFALLISDHIHTYLTLINRQKAEKKSAYNRQLYHNRDAGGLYLSAGVFTPLNAVNPVFGTNPYFGIGGLTSFNEDFIFDIFIKARLNNNDRDFDYEFYQNVERVNSSASYMFGGMLGYKFLDLNKFLSTVKVGYSIERINTGLKETYEIRDGVWRKERTRHHRMRSHNISAGISVMQHVKGKNFIGLQGLYHYSPYNRNRNLLTSIDSDYVSLEFFFKF